jgi:hypothetical protein
MTTEKMAKLVLEVPERWANFIDEYFQVTGYNRVEDLTSNVERIMGLYLADLPPKEQVSLAEKYRLSDIYDIPQRVRDAAAGIKCADKPVPASVLGAVFVEMVRGDLIDRPLVDYAYRQIGEELPAQYPPMFS